MFRELYNCKVVFEHCWNVLKHAPKWLDSHKKETPTRRRMATTSSPSNLDLINLEDEDVTHASTIDLERPLGRKVEKVRLNKQKSNKGTNSNAEVMFNVMVEEKKLQCNENGIS